MALEAVDASRKVGTFGASTADFGATCPCVRRTETLLPLFELLKLAGASSADHKEH